MSEGFGTVEPIVGQGGSFRWARVPRQGRLSFLVAVPGWQWYKAHFYGHGYVRCQGSECVWCERNLPKLNRMLLGGRIPEKRGQWALEIPEGAGGMVQEIAAARGGINGVMLEVRREGFAGRGEIQCRDALPDVPRGPDVIDPDDFLRWITKQSFWVGWTGPHE